jgi:hypothetical protein
MGSVNEQEKNCFAHQFLHLVRLSIIRSTSLEYIGEEILSFGFPTLLLHHCFDCSLLGFGYYQLMKKWKLNKRTWKTYRRLIIFSFE